MKKEVYTPKPKPKPKEKFKIGNSPRREYLEYLIKRSESIYDLKYILMEIVDWLEYLTQERTEVQIKLDPRLSNIEKINEAIRSLNNNERKHNGTYSRGMQEVS